MKKILLSVLFLSFAASCFAADEQELSPASKPVIAANAPNPDKIPVLKKLKEQGGDLAYDYLGRRFGTDAWLISGKGVMQVVYTAPNGIAAVVGGVLIGPDGQEISTTMQREFTEQNPERARLLVEQARAPISGSETATTAEAAATPEKPASKSEIIWARLSKLGLVTFAVKEITEPVPIVYAVLDPSQMESKTAFEKMLPLAESGKIVLHVVPLATVTADRLMEIAQTLAAPDAPVLWKKIVAGEDFKIDQTIDPKGAAALNENVKFAQSLKLYQVPFLFYRVPDAGAWGKVQALKGLPKDWNVLFKDLKVQ